MKRVIYGLGLLIYLCLMALVIQSSEHKAEQTIKSISCTPAVGDAE